MKRIYTSKGQEIIVDDGDYDELNKHLWYVRKTLATSYAQRSSPSIEGKRSPHTLMHRVIMNAPKDKCVDHINHNGLDNRKENLRICTHAENSRNASISTRNTSGYKGVTWHKTNKRWSAYIKVNGKGEYLGYYGLPEDAARAYDEAATKHFGEFAKLNFPRKVG